MGASYTGFRIMNVLVGELAKAAPCKSSAVFLIGKKGEWLAIAGPERATLRVVGV